MKLGCSAPAWLLPFAGLLLLAPSARAQTAGDYDGDGDVDGDDFWHWAGCMTGPAGSLSDPNCAAFDFTLSQGDGKVDLADFAAFGRAFTGSPCTWGRKYAFARKFGSATGSSAQIRTRTTTLCGQPNSEAPSSTVAFAGVSLLEGSTPVKWAQLGYMRWRPQPSPTIEFKRFAEIKAGPAPGDFDRHLDDPPSEGTYEYKCYLMSPLFGTWKYDYDGAPWWQFTRDGWKNVTGNRYEWAGEIWNREDQMVGTTAAKCDFTQCQYAVDWGSFQDADITADSTYTDDPNEWGVERTGSTSFNVWDKNP